MLSRVGMDILKTQDKINLIHVFQKGPFSVIALGCFLSVFASKLFQIRDVKLFHILGWGFSCKTCERLSCFTKSLKRLLSC